jgi:hypothetical protein
MAVSELPRRVKFPVSNADRDSSNPACEIGVFINMYVSKRPHETFRNVNQLYKILCNRQRILEYVVRPSMIVFFFLFFFDFTTTWPNLESKKCKFSVGTNSARCVVRVTVGMFGGIVVT